jgi:hypothetical protein
MDRNVLIARSGDCVSCPHRGTCWSRQTSSCCSRCRSTRPAWRRWTTRQSPRPRHSRFPRKTAISSTLAGCRRVLAIPGSAPCDDIRLVGSAPYHRITAYVPRATIFGMFSAPAPETEFQEWQGACIPSGLYGPATCSLISPDTSGAPIRITVRYSWWDCPGGPRERDTGTCVLRGVIPRATR